MKRRWDFLPIWLILGRILEVTNQPSIPTNCTEQLKMPCNVTLKNGLFSKVGVSVGGAGGVSRAESFETTYKCDEDRKPILHLTWSPSVDASFDVLTGYAISIIQSYSTLDAYTRGRKMRHLKFTVNNSDYQGKAYKIRPFVYEVPGVLACNWVYDIILYGLPVGPSNNHIQKELTVNTCPLTSASVTRALTKTKDENVNLEVTSGRTESSTSSWVYASEKTQVPAFSSSSTRDGEGVNIVVMAAVVSVAVLLTAIIVFLVWKLLDTIRNSHNFYNVDDSTSHSTSELPRVCRQETISSLDSGHCEDHIKEINMEYDSWSLPSGCSSFVPVYTY